MRDEGPPLGRPKINVGPWSYSHVSSDRDGGLKERSAATFLNKPAGTPKYSS
jgi:hypothetical protein